MMQYTMRLGALSENGAQFAQIKNTFSGPRKTISLPDGSTQYQTDITLLDPPAEKSGDVRYRVYTLKNSSGDVLMEAHPGYAKGDDPDVVCWPICRVPKVDHAEIRISGSAYQLVMHNSQNYSLQDKNGSDVLQIMHKGLSGGWTMDTAESFTAQVLCGLFIFCRYIEQENEFIVV